MSNIDPSKPTEGQATTQSVRDNFSAAATEIDANAAAIAVLQPGGGGSFNDYLAGYENTGFIGPSPIDLDTIVRDATYFVSASATNAPADYNLANRGYITTIVNSAVSGIQLLYGRSTTDNAYKQWMRWQNGGGWQAWKLAVDGGAFTERLAGYADNGIHTVYTGDLNAIAANSLYYCNAADVTNGPLDFDSASTAFLETNMQSSGWCVQTLWGLNSTAAGKTWQRRQNSGAWSAWELIVNGAATSVAYAEVGTDGTTITRTTGKLACTNPSVGKLEFTFLTGVGDAQYNVMATPRATQPRMLSVANISAAGFTVTVHDENGALSDGQAVSVLCSSQTFTF